MSINYQELVPEKALGKEISRHIFQTYRAKTGLPHEIEQNIEHIKRLNPEYEYHLFTTPTHTKKRIAVGDTPTAIRFLFDQEARRPYYSWTI